MTPLRIGTVPFLNAAPLTFGLDRDPRVALSRLLPAPLGEALERGLVDAALVPVAAYFRIDGLRLLPVAAIASDGAVRSVRLFHTKPLDRVRRVALDAGSVTSAALVRVVLRRVYDVRPEFVPAPPTLAALRDADAVLVIGDAALNAEVEAERDGIASLDLGTAWKEMTFLPFVYAVFALRESAPPSIGPLLREAKTRGLAARLEIASAFAADKGLGAASLVDYLERNIRFDLGPREMSGLRLFQEALLEEDLLDRPRDIKVARV
jgi:chorismate dehydratase